MSVPIASQDQIDKMQAIAEERMRKDGLLTDPVVPQVQEVEQEQVEEVYEEAQEASGDTDGVDQESHIDEIAQAAPTQKDFNLRSLRKQAEAAEYERQRAERAERERDEMLRLMMAQQQPKQQEAAPVKKQERFALQIDDDSLMEGRHARMLAEKMAQMEEKLNYYEQQAQKTDQHTLEMRLKSQFPDFEKVVTKENLDKLSSINPDISHIIFNNSEMKSDQYRQAKFAYDMVKQFGVYQDDTTLMQRMMVDKNNAKPKPATSLSSTKSDSPLSKANSFAYGPLTKELKQKMNDEMTQFAKLR